MAGRTGDPANGIRQPQRHAGAFGAIARSVGAGARQARLALFLELAGRAGTTERHAGPRRVEEPACGAGGAERIAAGAHATGRAKAGEGGTKIIRQGAVTVVPTRRSVRAARTDGRLQGTHAGCSAVQARVTAGLRRARHAFGKSRIIGARVHIGRATLRASIARQPWLASHPHAGAVRIQLAERCALPTLVWPIAAEACTL